MNDTLVILLCKNTHKYVISLKGYLQDFVDTIICEENLDIPKNYIGLNRIKKIPRLPIAWENAFFTLFNNQAYDKYQFVYFIEDDVYSKNPQTFLNLIKLYSNYTQDLIASNISSRNDQPYWHWWKDEDIIKYNQHTKSFNPLCRLSRGLIEHIKSFFQKHDSFCFHETLFASLAIDNNLKILDFKQGFFVQPLESCSIVHQPTRYFNSSIKLIGDIRYRPVYNIDSILDEKIYHPVKNLGD